MNTNELSFPQFIRMECVRKNISIKRMCEDLDIDYPVFNATYRRSKTRATWLLKIADYFDVDVRDLILMKVK